MKNHILGCWKHDFDKILLTYWNNKWLNWIYGWTRWANRWQPAPIEMGWEFTIEPYPSWRFGFIDHRDCWFGSGSVWTRTRTRSDGPELLLTLFLGDLHQKYVLHPFDDDSSDREADSQNACIYPEQLTVWARIYGTLHLDSCLAGLPISNEHFDIFENEID